MNSRISEILKRVTEEEEESGFYKGLSYNTMNESNRKAIFQQNPKHKSKSSMGFTKFVKVAAIILGFFIISSVMLISLNDGGVVSGVKGKIGQIITKDDMNMLAIKNEGISSVDDTKVKEVQISDWNKVRKAQNFLPQLYIPNYIPDRYQFTQLNVQNNSRGIYTADYHFRSEDDKTLIITQYKKVDTHNLIIENNDSRTLSNGEIVYIANGNFDERIIATYMNDNDKFDISGEITKSELENIILNLEK